MQALHDNEQERLEEISMSTFEVTNFLRYYQVWGKNEVTQFPWLESIDFEQPCKLYALKTFNLKYLLSSILNLTFSFSPLPLFFFFFLSPKKAIHPGAGYEGVSEYKSVVYYQVKQPYWYETVKVRVHNL